MHLDEGRLQALLDGELPGEEERGARSHLASCADCLEALEELGTRAALVSGALGSLDVPVPMLPARAALRRRLEGRAGGGAPPPAPTGREPRGNPRWLRAAAMILVSVGVGASALPGSPVREWVAREWMGASRGETPAATGTPSAVAPAAAAEVAVFLPPNGGQVRVDLAGLPEGAMVRVELVDRGDAAIFAPGGSRFETSPGRLHASVEGDRVRVEFPKEVPWATLWVNGERTLTRSGGRLELSGPGARVEGDTIVFRLPAAGTPPADRP